MVLNHRIAGVRKRSTSRVSILGAEENGQYFLFKKHPYLNDLDFLLQFFGSHQNLGWAVTTGQSVSAVVGRIIKSTTSRVRVSKARQTPAAGTNVPFLLLVVPDEPRFISLRLLGKQLSLLFGFLIF